ncbi:MAG: hypothetical protein ACUVXA_19410 [Candidatus Jordarchaeum sp.]|uniref:hypothetical protein n=1 Tax=Candidatus Jordarchaeum sp. TaxID=2823881 RepID=UPI00404AF128
MQDWILPYSKILLALGGVGREVNAAIVAFHLALETGGAVIGFHVHESDSSEADAKHFFEDIKKIASKYRVKFEIKYCGSKKSAAQEIIRELKTGGYDVCICTARMKFWSKFFGSVSREIVRKSPVRVILVYNPDRYEVLPEKLSTIIIPRESEYLDRIAIETISTIASSWFTRNVKIFFVHVTEIPPTVPIEASLESTEIRDEELGFLREVSKQIVSTATNITPGVIVSRDRAKGIGTFAKNVNANLIVMGAERKNYAPRYFSKIFRGARARFVESLADQLCCPAVFVFP